MMTLTSLSLLSKQLQVCSLLPEVVYLCKTQSAFKLKQVSTTWSLSVIWFESITGVFKHSESGDYTNKLVCMCVTKTTNNSLYSYCGRSFWYINSLISTTIPVQVFPTLIPSPIKVPRRTFWLSFWLIL